MRTVTDGAQAIHRAADLLALLTPGEGIPRRIAELARTSGLPEPTVARILKALAGAGIVVRTPEGRWRLGPACYVLGRAAGVDLVAVRWRQAVSEVAASTGDVATAWWVVGPDLVCVQRIDGAYPMRPASHRIGDRLSPGDVDSRPAWLVRCLAEPDAIARGCVPDATGEDGVTLARAVTAADTSEVLGMLAVCALDRRMTPEHEVFAAGHLAGFACGLADDLAPGEFASP